MGADLLRRLRPGACIAAGLLGLMAAGAGAAPAPDSVQRQGQGWVIDTTGRSVAELAEALAQASGSQLLGAREVLAAAPLRARAAWQAASLDEAWALLLDGRVSHARQCTAGRAARCRVWLVASPTAGAAPAPSTPAAPVVASPPAPAPVALLPARPAAPPAAQPATPRPLADPPGLFPAEPT